MKIYQVYVNGQPSILDYYTTREAAEKSIKFAEERTRRIMRRTIREIEVNREHK